MSKTSAHLSVDGISKTFPDRRVFTDITFAVPYRDRMGIIGENGSGKTTLLQVIAGELEPDAGTIEVFASNHSILPVGLLHQEPPFNATLTLAQTLEASVAHLRQAEVEVHTAAEALAAAPDDAAAVDRYTNALSRAEHLGVWDIDSHIETTIDGLGLQTVDREKTIDALSGGQRARLAMASLLLSAPEVLLLDEPTNHLDDAAIRYLGTVIANWHGPVLIVSHDRAFLDETVLSILDLDPAPRPHVFGAADDELTTLGVTRFTGTYSDYLHARRDARQRWQHQYAEEQAHLKRLRAAVDENQVVGHEDWKPRTEVRMAQRYFADRNAKVVARRVNDARARLAELEARQVVKPPKPLMFRGLTAATQQETRIPENNDAILDAVDVAVANRLAPTSLTISATDKVLITGANGTGKSTLLQLLAGSLHPTRGRIHRATDVSIGILTQESHFGDVGDETTSAVYAQAVGPDLAERVPLSTFGLLHPRDEHRPVATLSVGQQRRLALAILLADPPAVLLLDEPTNHLSLTLVTELEASIEHYPGAVVIATHDRWLRNRWQDHQLHLE